MKKLASIVVISLLSQLVLAAATPEENVRTCLSGKYHALCNYDALSPNQRAQAQEARKLENLNTCLKGKYAAICNRYLLSQEELGDVFEAEKRENLKTCMFGKYKALCKYELLSTSELTHVKGIEKQENFKTCKSGLYPTLCDHSQLSSSERKQVELAEQAASQKASQIETSRTTAPIRKNSDSYLIEMSHDDELFIINGEKYEAQTYCLGWNEGEEVLFIEGSSLGACATAKLYNVNRRESCDVWCE